MEQHPVPRNITGFQFKLIGDMTLKQFGYLAAGAIFGYTLLKLLPFPFFINIFIGGVVFFIGFAFAFLPYADRPLDQWLTAFIKSVYSPTQFIYLKQNEPPEILLSPFTYSTKKITEEHQKNFSVSRKMLATYLSKLPKKTTDFFDENEKIMINQTLSLFAQSQPSKTFQNNKMIQTVTMKQSQAKTQQPVSPVILEAQKPKTAPPPVHPNIKSKEEKEKELENDNYQMKQLIDELTSLRQQIQKQGNTQTPNNLLEKRFLELEQKLTLLLTDRERLTAEIAKLKQQPLTNKSVTPQPSKEEPLQTTVKIISHEQATRVGILNPPNTPNLVIGIVKDGNGIFLSNILITVKDMRATPLRALKTNKLGQFFASTPLPNGRYFLEIEDPMKRYSFDLVQLDLTGQIVQPLEIIAKRQADPIRERLTKELFQKSFG